MIYSLFSFNLFYLMVLVEMDQSLLFQCWRGPIKTVLELESEDEPLSFSPQLEEVPL